MGEGGLMELDEIADEVLGLRKPAAALRHAACCERGNPRFHRAYAVLMAEKRTKDPRSIEASRRFAISVVVPYPSRD
jgi:hypothetical protein